VPTLDNCRLTALLAPCGRRSCAGLATTAKSCSRVTVNTGPLALPRAVVSVTTPLSAVSGTFTLTWVREALSTEASALPKKRTWFSLAVGENSRPLMVTVVPTSPCTGLSAVITGAGDSSVTVSALDCPPLVTTRTTTLPASFNRLPGTLARSCVALRYSVARLAAPNTICAPATKFAPVAVMTCASPLASRVAGETEVSTGAGGSTCTVSAFDCPPVLVTLTATLPAVASRLPGTLARSCVALRYSLTRLWVPNTICAPGMKLAPLAVIDCAAPLATKVAGATLVSAGTGGSTWKVIWLDAPPPGAGCTTLTCTLRATTNCAAGTSTYSSLALCPRAGRVLAPKRKDLTPQPACFPTRQKTKPEPRP
jgi:hypothetical protein